MIKMWEEIMEQPDVLERCMQRNGPVIRELAGRLGKSDIRSIMIAARGTSDHAAVYGKYVLEFVMHKPAALAASSIFTVYGGSLDLKDSLVIGISQSGEAEDVLEVLRGARASGALTVGITNFTGSPVAQACDFHLSCEAGAEKSVAATKTFTAELLLLAMLASEWSGGAGLARELERLPEGVGETLGEAASVIEKTARYRFMDECFVLARGFNYAISLETALKIQETAYVRAKAFAASDFRHGPIAMLERNIPVIVFAPEGPSLADMSSMAEELGRNGVESIMVSNNRKMLELGACSFRIPATDNDMLSPFYNIVIAQMFACRLAAEKGLDPDRPRRLSKVTITR